MYPIETLEIQQNFGNLIFNLPAEEKTLIRKLEKHLYKLNAAETATIFNLTRQGDIPE